MTTTLRDRSEALRHLRDQILRFGHATAPLLITGETGTGKEVVARCAHEVSGRQGQFVPINCAAIPLTLIESELFGSERGAFTDAVSRPGSFERANGGTLFLDELGEMPLETQVRLLRVLESKAVTRVGGAKSIPLDVRVIAATNLDLAQRVRSSRFRDDLYYRVAVLPIEVPPLRHRPEDIGGLADHFLGTAAQLDESALTRLQVHQWPGNVRELRNVLERAQALLDPQETLIREQHLIFL